LCGDVCKGCIVVLEAVAIFLTQGPEGSQKLGLKSCWVA
jgi:hypothetical protein